MTNMTVSRLGLVNATGSSYDALFLKVFSGEVLTAFSENNVFNERMQTVRTISSGKSAQFPVLGTATAAYHTVGTPLVGANQIKANEKIISIDDLLISQAFLHPTRLAQLSLVQMLNRQLSALLIQVAPRHFYV